jgi:uncharacterized OB-fold protein
MATETATPVVEGWFEETDDGPKLIGTRCVECGTYYFPKQTLSCRNPSCDSQEFEETHLSNTGKIWSFTNAGYAPPEPYVSGDDFEPFIIAAVELEHEKMVILGQMTKDTDLDDLAAGKTVELTIEEIFEDDGVPRTTWKWKLA